MAVYIRIHQCIFHGHDRDMCMDKFNCWVKFENDLLCATLTMLSEVASDAKKVKRDPIYANMLSAMLNSIKKSVIAIENYDECSTFTKKVDHYIRSSLRSAFAKMLDNGNSINESITLQEKKEKLIQIAKGTEELALREQSMFSSVLKKWHPISAGIAAVTLHTCYGNLLKKFITKNSTICSETLAVLQQADKLEKVLVNMVVEDYVACKDIAKPVVREMVRYDVDSIVLRLLRQWIQESLKTTKDVVHTAKETETWNPTSKSEPYAHSALELTRQTKDAIDTFFKIPIGVSEDLIREFANAIEDILHDYINFVASCGSKQSYVPTLPHLTRCGCDSTFIKLWRMAATPPCSVANPSEVGF
ncbi:protein unc-13 homolog [Rutidosis leptorrhynchoides]|uniref:protein unc-13 homolog n=1 Tax=Rutidosis leptorrhynchoides TaxID=125765 RepID=UPI003A98FB0C